MKTVEISFTLTRENPFMFSAQFGAKSLLATSDILK